MASKDRVFLFLLLGTFCLLEVKIFPAFQEKAQESHNHQIPQSERHLSRHFCYSNLRERVFFAKRLKRVTTLDRGPSSIFTNLAVLNKGSEFLHRSPASWNLVVLEANFIAKSS